MNKRFGNTTKLCKGQHCKDRKRCAHFLALIERKNDLNGEETYMDGCEKLIINLPKNDNSTDCLFSSKENYCYKHHGITCEMECKRCNDYYKKTL